MLLDLNDLLGSFLLRNFFSAAGYRIQDTKLGLTASLLAGGTAKLFVTAHTPP